MLQIRSEQMDLFQPIAEEAFLRRIVEYLRTDHARVAIQLPEGLSLIEQLPERVLRTMVRAGIARAREYGMRGEAALVSFVTLMFIAAPNFYQHPLIARVLNDEKTLPDDRIDQLWQHTSEQNWEIVKQKYDARAWQLTVQEGGL